jgi:SAM-dependent methyltransferase
MSEYLRSVEDREAWELEADSWVEWARSPGHDAYWYFRDSFFDVMLPPPGALTLEVGCGEGRVTRDLLDRGHRVVALDGSPTLLRYARESDPVQRYVLTDAHSLPLPDAAVDLVVAYNSLMDFDDMPVAVAEVSRVLTVNGVFCICITHPMLEGGAFEGEDDDAPYVLREPYLTTRRFDATFTRGDHTMHFRGWSHPLAAYFEALTDSGFVVDLLREPFPEPGIRTRERWLRFPMFLHLRARKAARS